MKKLSLVLVLGVMVSLVYAGAALARSMTVVNKTGAEVVALNISKDNGDNVNNNLNKPLANGKSITVSLDSGNTGWNVLAIDSKDTAHVGENLNFSGKSRIILGGGTVKVQ